MSARLAISRSQLAPRPEEPRGAQHASHLRERAADIPGAWADRDALTYVRAHLKTSGSAQYRWSSQDLVSVDGLPLVGAYAPGVRHLWTATGFAKWGLAAGARRAGRSAPGSCRGLRSGTGSTGPVTIPSSARAAADPVRAGTTFRYGDHKDQMCDLRLPQGHGPHPVVALLHGGSWGGRWTRHTLRPLAGALVRAGWATGGRAPAQAIRVSGRAEPR